MDLQNEVEQTVRMIGLFSLSSGSSELCRRLATDELFGEGTVGVQVYALTNTGRWQIMGTYGKNPYDGQDLSQFDENLLTQTAKSRDLAFGEASIDDTAVDVWGCVAIRSDLPVGAIVRTSTKNSFVFQPANGTLKAVQDAAGLFLDAVGFKTISNSPLDKQTSPADLSGRQLAILISMASGKTNLSIAHEMILSESTIKQESVKIFKALSVATRQQAVLKAEALGLLPRGTDIAL